MKRLFTLTIICVIVLFIFVHQNIYERNRYTTAFIDVNSNVTTLKNNIISSNITQNPLNYITNNVRNDKDGVIKTEDVMRIGILIPTTTRNMKGVTLERISLVKTCLPSIYMTLEHKYNYTIYIGVDKNDYLETVIDQLEKFDKVTAVISTGRTFTKSVNAMAKKAYQDGMDYLVRINDDSTFETNEWTTMGISVLQGYIPKNVGVVGPTCHEGNTGILTHDMVHRTHLEIFTFYYPSYFDNWWADDWITRVYSPNRSQKLPTWVMKHHLNLHGTRYHVDFKKHGSLEKVLTFDKKRLLAYISKNNQTNGDS